MCVVCVCVCGVVCVCVVCVVCVCVCVCVSECVWVYTQSYVAAVDSALFISNLFISFETLRTYGFGNRCALKTHGQLHSNSAITS